MTTRTRRAAAPTRPDPDVTRPGLHFVDPARLRLGPNARTDTRIDPEFVASIRERGVLQPITCYTDVTDGALVVEIGQRRAIVATQLGLPSVPVLVLAEPPDDVDRLLDQLVENDQRTPVTTAEHAAAVQQLAAFGLSAAAIAKRAALRREQVDAAITVATSPVAAAAAAEHDLTLDQAAAIAEFADDPDVVAEITAAAADGRPVAHVVEHAREVAAERAETARVAAELRGRGITVLDDIPPWNASGPLRRLNQLGIDPDTHTACPGHACYILHRDDYVDGRYVTRAAPTWVCLDAPAHGHTTPAAGQTTLAGEQARADRAEVIRRNREWRAATVVRRRFIRDLAARRTPPAGAEQFVLGELLRGGNGLAEVLLAYDHHELLREWLCPQPDDGPATPARAQLDQLVDQAAALTPKRATVHAVVLLYAAWETHHLRDDGWRSHDATDRRLLAQLVTWGYPPADIEQQTVLAQPGDPR